MEIQKSSTENIRLEIQNQLNMNMISDHFCSQVLVVLKETMYNTQYSKHLVNTKYKKVTVISKLPC